MRIKMLGKEKIENYLKTIYKLQLTSDRVRGTDVASALQVSRPTVCVALKDLRKCGYVRAYDDGSISLTKKRLAKAQDIENRFSFLTDMLIFLNVDRSTAARDACRLEHSLSDDSYRALQQFFIAKIS